MAARFILYVCVAVIKTHVVSSYSIICFKYRIRRDKKKKKSHTYTHRTVVNIIVRVRARPSTVCIISGPIRVGKSLSTVHPNTVITAAIVQVEITAKLQRVSIKTLLVYVCVCINRRVPCNFRDGRSRD